MFLGTRVHLHFAGVRRRSRAQEPGGVSGLSLHHFLGLRGAVCVALPAKPGRDALARRAATGAVLCTPLLEHPGRDRHVVVREGHPAYIREVDETTCRVCTSCRTPPDSFLAIHGAVGSATHESQPMDVLAAAAGGAPTRREAICTWYYSSVCATKIFISPASSAALASPADFPASSPSCRGPDVEEIGDRAPAGLRRACARLRACRQEIAAAHGCCWRGAP